MSTHDNTILLLTVTVIEAIQEAELYFLLHECLGALERARQLANNHYTTRTTTGLLATSRIFLTFRRAAREAASEHSRILDIRSSPPLPEIAPHQRRSSVPLQRPPRSSRDQ